MIRWLVLLFLAFPAVSWAQKLSLGGGFYSLNANAGSSSGSSAGRGGALSGIGAFDLQWQQELLSQIEVSIGYSLFFSNFPGGDLGFGPDLGVVWFPISSNKKVQFANNEIAYSSQEVWRPFVGMAFHHIQFQSLQSSFSGFGFSGGTEFLWNKNFSVFIKCRIKTLNGPNQSAFSTTEILLGPVFEF